MVATSTPRFRAVASCKVATPSERAGPGSTLLTVTPLPEVVSAIPPAMAKRRRGNSRIVTFVVTRLAPSMVRPLRIELAGALQQFASRGDRLEASSAGDADREAFLDVPAEAVERYNRSCHAFFLVTKQYHFVIEMVAGNLSWGMRQPWDVLFARRCNNASLALLFAAGDAARWVAENRSASGSQEILATRCWRKNHWIMSGRSSC